MSAPFHTCRSGVTLVEVLFAGTILVVLALSLFEGIGVAGRIAAENTEYLAADAVAFDLAYKRSREPYAALQKLRTSLNGGILTEVIPSNACPMLARRAPEARTRVECARDATGAVDPDALLLSVDVAWGPVGARRLLSSRFGPTRVVKSNIGLKE